MARSTEKLAFRLMKALEAEFEREPDATKARPVLEVSVKIFKSQEEFDRVMVFVGPKRKALINSWRRDGELVSQPNEAGFAWIGSHKTPFTLQRLSWIVGILFAVITFAWGVFVWLNR